MIYCISSKPRATRYEAFSERHNLPVRVFAAVDELLANLRELGADLVLADVPPAGMTAEALLLECRAARPETPVIFCGAGARTSEVMRLAKFGLFHYVSDDSTEEELLEAVEAALRTSGPSRERSGEPEPAWRRLLVGDSDAMKSVCRTIQLVSSKRCTVLITGETGTGKEMAARALHMASSRARYPMVAVNCGAIPENLLEDELFGHVKGAFTGANNARAGRFEQAHNSTLFLDEVGELPLDLQAKLLRVLQEREFQRLGGSETIKVDVRIIAATNCDLAEKVRQGKFREDLYYRLNVVPVRLPPLRERRSDIPKLVHHFIEKICRREEIPIRRIDPSAMQALMRHSWPGNVRELENAIETAVALSGDNEILTVPDFPLFCDAPEVQRFPVQLLPVAGCMDLEEAVTSYERSIIEQAMRTTNGNQKMAAEMLGVKRTTLIYKLRSLNLIGERALAS